MDNYIETIEHKDYTIQMFYASDYDDPLTWTTPKERGATFVLSHKRYNVPCEIDVNFDDYAGWEDVAQSKAKGKPYKFVDWYEHGGVVVALQDKPIARDKWDSGIVGFIFGDNELCIESAFSEWKDYIEGNVYDYVIYDKDDNEVDRLCCLYGYDYAVEQAKEAIDAL